MSYCRQNDVDSDVYVINMNPCIEEPLLWCLGCKMDPKGIWSTDSRVEMFMHLLDHKEFGSMVPDRAIERLTRESPELYRIRETAGLLAVSEVK